LKPSTIIDIQDRAYGRQKKRAEKKDEQPQNRVVEQHYADRRPEEPTYLEK